LADVFALGSIGLRNCEREQQICQKERLSMLKHLVNPFAMRRRLSATRPSFVRPDTFACKVEPKVQLGTLGRVQRHQKETCCVSSVPQLLQAVGLGSRQQRVSTVSAEG